MEMGDVNCVTGDGMGMCIGGDGFKTCRDGWGWG